MVHEYCIDRMNVEMCICKIEIKCEGNNDEMSVKLTASALLYYFDKTTITRKDLYNLFFGLSI